MGVGGIFFAFAFSVGPFWFGFLCFRRVPKKGVLVLQIGHFGYLFGESVSLRIGRFVVFRISLLPGVVFGWGVCSALGYFLGLGGVVGVPRGGS